MGMTDEERRRHMFLDDVSRDIARAGAYRIPEASEIGERILAQLRTEKGLTYVAAYAGLQYAAEMLRAESNFVQVQPTHNLTELVQQQLTRDHHETE